MCNRESFVLFPEETGIPVAWTVSYHHEEILSGARMYLACYGIATEGLRPNHVQIECKNGDVKKWDWDNTPTKTIMRPMPQKINFEMIWNDTVIPINTTVEVIEDTEPDIPHWLEDNLHKYENRIEKILEQLNPWRDRSEKLYWHLNHGGAYYNTGPNKPEITDYIKFYRKDSEEVREFEQIINAYRKIPGFVSTL